MNADNTLFIVGMLYVMQAYTEKQRYLMGVAFLAVWFISTGITRFLEMFK